MEKNAKNHKVMAKPILVVRTPKRDNIGDVRAALVTQFKGEYHVLMVINPDDQADVSFEVHNASELTPSDMAELRKIVHNHNKQYKINKQVITSNEA